MDYRGHRRRLVVLCALAIMTIALGATIVWMTYVGNTPFILQLILGLGFTCSLIALIWGALDRDSSTARQTDEILQLSSRMLDCMTEGLTAESAQQICELILPATPAIAVAITDREVILGYAGYNTENNRAGTAIRTTVTHQTLQDGMPRILHRADNIGLPMSSARISAAIIQPLFVGRTIHGSLKFYYRRSSQINQTQKSLAHGFAELLSTQMAASALEEQTKLATSMELKALQAQINPHFLFNTINTIASLIRTDAAKARELLREFAVFYRSTLEDADDFISLDREIQQVQRYFMFEVARFGEERLALEVDIEDEVYSMLIPSFMIQPLVENAVKHAMGAEGLLTVRITGTMDKDNIVICVIDDGVGMSEETAKSMFNKASTTGLGIAVKNVQDRLHGYFGSDAHMAIESEIGRGTTVSFTLDKRVVTGGYAQAEQLQETTLPDIPEPITD